MAANIGHETLVCCHELLVSEIAGDPEQMAGILFQHRFISEDTKDKINELDKTKTHKARLLTDDIERKVKSYPEFYEKFLAILRDTPLQYLDLVKALGEEYEKMSQKATTVFESYPVALPPQLSVTMQQDFPEIIGLPELPTADNMGTVPNPLESPPDIEEVGRDIRAAATSQRELPDYDDLLEGKLLKVLQSGEYTKAIELLSQAETQSVDLRSVRDSDGKTLLHLACRKHFLDWYPVVQSLIEEHDCDVSAVDEDGNTPLHDAYQCGNKEVVLLLLSKLDCNPDAFNKNGFNVLRMALQKNDTEATRALLATGRVDPRRGSPRGHTYHEVMEMDGTLPQDINDSALQMVTKCAKCIENSSLGHPNFAAHYLLDVLRVIFKNRDNISINGIVKRIKENKTPIPEKPEKIHDLLIGLSDEFEVCKHEGTHEYGNIQIHKKGCLPDDFVQHGIPLQNLSQLPDRPDTSFEQTVEKQSAEETDLDTNLIEDEEPPEYSDTERLLPALQPSTTNLNNARRDALFTAKTCFCLGYYCCWFTITLILGVCGAIFYNDYSLDSVVLVAQIHRPSVPFIGEFDKASSIIFVEVGDLLPIKVYTLGQCFSQDSLMNVSVDETVTVSFGSQNKSKSLAEWYFLANTTLTVIITTDVLPNYPADHCIAFIVVFSHYDLFKDFLLTSSIEGYEYNICIKNNAGPHIGDFNFPIQSYFYFGVYSEIPAEVDTVSAKFVGSYSQFDLSNLTFNCIINSFENLKCTFTPNPSQDACIVGSIPPADAVSGVRETVVGFATTSLSNSVIDTYFFIPFILVSFLAFVIFCCLLVCGVCNSCQRQ